MLKAKDRELISAYLDGEVLISEREEAVRLLLENSEAARLHAALMAQRNAVRRSAVRPFSVDLRTGVFDRMNRRRPSTKIPLRRLAFLWCLAASLFAIVGLASFNIFFRQPGNAVAGRTKPGTATAVSQADNPPLENAGPAAAVVSGHRVKDEMPDTTAVEVLPLPRPAGNTDGVLAVPAGPEFELNRTVTSGRLSLLMALKDLNQDASAARLRAELGRDEVVRIDLFCRDIGKSHEHLVAALKGKGLGAHLDASLAERFKRKLVGEVIYFTESLTQAEMVALFQQLARDDAARAAKANESGQFDSLVLLPHQSSDIDRLSRSTGVPTIQLKLPRKPAAVDPKASLEANTGTKIAQAIRAGSKAVNQFLAVPYFIGDKGAAPVGKETKAFMEQRGDGKYNAKPLILILRQL